MERVCPLYSIMCKTDVQCRKDCAWFDITLNKCTIVSIDYGLTSFREDLITCLEQLIKAISKEATE